MQEEHHGGEERRVGTLLMVMGKLLLAIIALLPSSLPILHNYGWWQWTMEAAVDNDGTMVAAAAVDNVCGGGG